ncbi:hypothetical protein C1H46_024601 [Malus baccata]|uniref:Uncharacterized protein n=1 Tax=Malus baccata TaxID=106549 RepID=A0A540LTK7_MALBA|nr:hypothetical protein C1H46_024601 [Malus baccata]
MLDRMLAVTNVVAFSAEEVLNQGSYLAQLQRFISIHVCMTIGIDLFVVSTSYVCVKIFHFEGAAKEDGRGPSIWDPYTHIHRERIVDGSNGDVAVDQYHSAVKVYKDKYQAFQKGVTGITLLTHWFVPASETKEDKNAALISLDFMFAELNGVPIGPPVHIKSLVFYIYNCCVLYIKLFSTLKHLN